MLILDRRSLLRAGFSLPGAAFARQNSPTGPSLFEQVIGRPTARSGYEELVTAADELSRRDPFKEADANLRAREAVPLVLKRRVLADPRIRDALDLLRRGLTNGRRAVTLVPDG